jgi:outer membrane scaffolding protein for murein synthesis (MipA/OmpV family)
MVCIAATLQGWPGRPHQFTEIDSTLRRFICLALLLGALGPRLAWSQTPSPLQEWQYSGGIILQRLFQPNAPDWFAVTGLATAAQPVYEGASAYRVRFGPVINIRYKDIAYASTGEGVGYNFLRGRYYRVGVSVGYDTGRRVPDDYPNLHGIGDLSVAPVVKLYGTYVLSKDFPMVIRIDARHYIGGAAGDVGDFGFYLPLPGSSKGFFMFAGPSITWATHRYVQKVFGVTAVQSLASDKPIFDVHGGTNAAGIGLSATKVLSQHWLLNLDTSTSWLQGSAANSPITEAKVRHTLALSINYHW